MNKEININLAPHKQNKAEEHTKFVKVLQLIAFTSLFIVVFLASGLFVLNNTTSLPFLKQQKSAVLSQLTGLGSKTIKLYLIKDRLTFARAILSDQSSFDQRLSVIKEQLPDDVSIQSISLSKKVVTLTLTSNSLLSLNTVIDTMTDSVSTKKNFKNITISSIILDSQDAKYTMILEGVLL